MMTAIQETNLRNLPYGMGGIGLFQQNPQYWGTASQIMTPTYAANKFFDALKGVADRDSKPLVEVAIDVQNPDKDLYHATFNTHLQLAQQLLGSDYKPAAADTTNQLSAAGVACSGTSGSNGVPGKVSVAPGANLPGKDINPVAMAFFAQAAGVYGHELVCSTGTNHSEFSTSGNVSDHFSGNACDFGMVANHGADDSPVGDAIATACLIAAGVSPQQAAQQAQTGGLFTLVHNGLRIQCIWKTYEGGNHHNHVHMGVQQVAQSAAVQAAAGLADTWVLTHLSPARPSRHVPTDKRRLISIYGLGNQCFSLSSFLRVRIHRLSPSTNYSCARSNLLLPSY
jgi:hypothetical protein